MKSLFVPEDRQALTARIASLDAARSRQWGTMDVAQMLCHCSRALETGSGDRPMKQKLIGKLLSPLVRKGALGDKPFSRNSPTDPTFVVRDSRNFERERENLLALIDRFVQRGPEPASHQTHAFFGRLDGQEWGRLMYKHIDHHLRQFGA